MKKREVYRTEQIKGGGFIRLEVKRWIKGGKGGGRMTWVCVGILTGKTNARTIEEKLNA